ncbi:hypothetical protein RHGRI_022548 [Rhododendron griersonianum]|uniref:Legume lectin domain-containing protein n=1 Tax=Rhododendron griersonianum TaxID=479676 RepID=A0AAV6J4H6_9ERIC|nr:hypothetical protein RHGRI_022548 [Rhododendron griersonianum]
MISIYLPVRSLPLRHLMGLAMKLSTIAAVVFCFTAVAAQNLTTFTATYRPIFTSNFFDAVEFEDAAYIHDNSIQLTKWGLQYVNQAGRAMLKQPFKLWEQGYNKTSDRVASFNSSFLFHIEATNGDQGGEGLAFIIAPNTSLPSNSSGQYLGLTNYNTDGSPENQLVAIELDNFKEDFDPDANHFNRIYMWNLTVDSYAEDVVFPEDKHPSWEKTLLIVGVGVPLALILAVMTGYYYYLRKKRLMAQSKSNVLLGTLKRLPGTPREFEFKDLKKATNNFDEKKKLGQGGFGVVYQGHLQNENLEVAVKWFSRETMKDVVEERLGDEYVIEEAQKMLILALACCHPIASERPRTQRIVQIISGLAPVPYVPPFKQAFVWPSMPSVDEDDISSSASPTESKGPFE